MHFWANAAYLAAKLGTAKRLTCRHYEAAQTAARASRGFHQRLVLAERWPPQLESEAANY